MNHLEKPPHGGAWASIKSGYVEISVYETGVPPHFRLYFYGPDRTPSPPPTEEASLETIRPDGQTQQFSFIPEPGCLRSTSDIPEPHEFAVNLHLGEQLVSVRFTEEGHGHSHDHGGEGWLGRLQGLFGHSHDAADKVDEALETSQRGMNVLIVTLVILLITSLFQVAIVIKSGSVALLADTIHNLGDATTSIPLWIAFTLTRRGVSRNFTYGYGKSEDLAGLAIVGMIFLSACVAGYESVQKILHPQPIDHLGLVAAAALVGFLGNEIVAVLRLKVGRKIDSAALIADGQHARVDGFTSLSVLIGVWGVWAGYPIVDPIVGCLITIAILFIVRQASVSVFKRMLDGIEPEILAQVERSPLYVQGVLSVSQARARWVGHRVMADLRVAVSPELTLEQAQTVTCNVQAVLRDHVRSFGGAVVQLAAPT